MRIRVAVGLLFDAHTTQSCPIEYSFWKGGLGGIFFAAKVPPSYYTNMHYESEHLPSELLAAREQTGCCFRLTLASKHVLPAEFRNFSMFNPENAMGGYDGRYDAEPSGIMDAAPPDPSPFAEDDSEDAIIAVLQRALDDMADMDREDPLFEDRMHELYPMLAKAMFSGGDEYTHRMTVTTEAFLLHRGDTWELSYTEPVEDGTDGTTRIWLPALDSAALTSDRYDITDGAEMLPGDARDKAVHTGKTLRIKRRGDEETLLVLTEGKRIVTSLQMAAWIGRPLDVCVYARRLDWKLDPERGGTIFMDYIIEIRGMDQQRTVLRLDLRPFAKAEERKTEEADK